MENTELKKKVQIAKDAVAGLEEPLRTEGFKTILAKLLDENKLDEGTKKNTIKSRERKIVENNIAEIELPALNRTEYPELYKLKNTLDKSLFILKIYQDKFDIDGLTPSQISKVLTETFRIKTSKESISMSLMNAKNEVHREKGIGKNFIYKIMNGGEKILKEKIENESR